MILNRHLTTGGPVQRAGGLPRLASVHFIGGPTMQQQTQAYDSAREATPRWFAVSFGNGNDGVSHMFPDYYVRTNDPFHLAAVAMLANFNNAGPEDKARIIDATEVYGEADYTITATIYNPEDVEPEDESTPDYESIATANGFAVVEHVDSKFVYVKVGVLGDSDDYDSEDAAFEACCEDHDLISDSDDGGSYCNANGCWIQCDVFAVDEMPGCMLITDRVDGRTVEHVQYNPYGKPAYCSLADAFNPEDLALTAD